MKVWASKSEEWNCVLTSPLIGRVPWLQTRAKDEEQKHGKSKCTGVLKGRIKVELFKIKQVHSDTNKKVFPLLFSLSL